MKSDVASGIQKNKFSFLIVSLLFLLSGLSSLIYQVIWTRMLVFVFGSTTFATSTVLAVFMGGLAVGSFLAGRLADKAENPFKWYGILEGAIGIWALLAPFMFAAAVPIYQLFFEPLHLQVIQFGLLRFAVAAIILLPPTACMGATLPLLSRFVTSSLAEVGDRVGSLYAVNTLGAVAGAIFGGFVLLPSFGISATTYIAAATNIFLALAVFGLGKRPEFGSKNLVASPAAEMQASAVQTEDAGQENPQSAEEKSSSSEQTAESGKSSSNVPNLVNATMLSFAVSGAIAMIYEVAWTRSLLMIIGSTTYAFTIMLSTFLLGIFLGSLLCSRFADRMKSPVTGFAIAQLTLCLVSFLAVYSFNLLPYLSFVFGKYSGNSPELTMFYRFVSAGLVMFPIAFVLGTIFPLAVKICALDLSKLGRSIGQLYSMNTLGAILGAFVAGFLVIPFLGSEKTLVYCSLANLLVGVFLLSCFTELRMPIKALALIASIAATVLASNLSFWDNRLLTKIQSDRRPNLLNPNPSKEIPSLQEWKTLSVANLLFPFYKEGKVANVAIVATPDGSHTLFTNGHPDASDFFDMENQAMLASFPLMLKPDAQDVCVVGWGSGVTAGFALRFPIKRMICSEIEPEVIQTSRFFHHVNFAPENDPRTIIEPSDGRNYLLGSKEKFDVIISEPSNPWQAGVCNLFTREYFSICKNKLKPGGIFTMWSQINEIQPRNLAQVFAALHESFPYVYVLNSGIGDVNAIACEQPLKINFEALKKGFANEKVRNALKRFHLETPEDFIARVMLCPDGIDAAVKNVAPNSDDRNRLEYEVSKTYENRLFREENNAWLKKNSTPAWNFIDWGKLSQEEIAQEYVKIGRASNSPDKAIAWAEQSNKVHPNANALALMAELYIATKNYEAETKLINDAETKYPADDRFPGLAGLMAQRKSDIASARNLLEKAIQLKPSNNDFRYFLACTYSDLDMHEQDKFVSPSTVDPAKVIELCKSSTEDSKFAKARPTVFILLANAYNQKQAYADAEQALKKLLAVQKVNYRGWRLLSETYALQKKWKEAGYCIAKSFACASEANNRSLSVAQKLVRDGKSDEAVSELRKAIELEPADQRAIELLSKLAKSNELAKAYYASIITDSSILKN